MPTKPFNPRVLQDQPGPLPPRAGREGVSQLLLGSGASQVPGQWARWETGCSCGTHSLALSAPASPAAPSGAIYLRQICKSEHVIFPLSSPGEGLWPERSRQIFEAGSGEPAAPCSQLTPQGSLASAGRGEIKDAGFAARMRPRQPPASHGELGISSRPEEPLDG